MVVTSEIDPNGSRTCPYCGIIFSPEGVDSQTTPINFQGLRGMIGAPAGSNSPVGRVTITSHLCPQCQGKIIWMNDVESVPQNGVFRPVIKSTTLLWPKSMSQPLSGEIPKPLATDFQEAVGTLSISPKASAALSRRCLQVVLRERFGIEKRDLYQEIQEFITIQQPPTYLAQQLHAIRAIGNLAAHPIKDSNTGTITEVEPGEAELLIGTISNLFDFAYVQPARWAAAKTAINDKLRAAGKPPIP